MIRPFRILGALLSLQCVLWGTAVEAASKPNIIYILADDLGYGDVQALNPEQGKIPTLSLIHI